jgi:hypothetical protein
MPRAALPGGTVELTGERQIGGAQAAITDAQGQYRFMSSTSGLYVISVSLAGFKTVIREDLQAQVNRTLETD